MTECVPGRLLRTVGVAVVLTAVAGCGGGLDPAPPNLGPRLDSERLGAPPTPVIRTLSARVRAEHGTFCWRAKSQGLCMDAISGLPPRHFLRATTREDVWIDLRVPARDLALEDGVKARRSAADGSIWRLHLPDRAPRTISFDVTYDRGTASFVAGLDRRAAGSR